MRNKTSEHVKIWRTEAIQGVEFMRARYRSHRFSRHFHEGFCLGVIEDGALGFRYCGENLLAPTGSVNLAVPGEVHDGHGADESGWAYRMFYMDAKSLTSAMSELFPQVPSFLHFKPGVLHDPHLARLVQGLHQDLEAGHLSTLEAQTRFLGLLTTWIGRHADDRPVLPGLRPEPRAIALAREIIEDRYAEDLSLQALAQETAKSPFHLARIFAAQHGMPPHAYQTQVRVNRAAAQLSSPASLADIAAATGFADQSHLTRWFKRYRGVTPGQYRKIV
ncbi:MAG: AraC family transcriptional regulator, partial [Proteobacteria bacterium]|nr:AraC family transcriptional regulator [Pseudomonadota bacterium]